MSKLSLNKASLHRENAKLKRYRQYLPSLDLKRRQLMVERGKCQAAVEDTQVLIAKCRQRAADTLPMLAYEAYDIGRLIRISTIEIGSENIVGTLVPTLKTLDFAVQHYSLYAKPHWVDQFIDMQQQLITLKIHLDIYQQRLQRLTVAAKKVTQKVNLFEKVLIPRSQDNIRRIKIFLSDAERADIVRAKITKQLRVGQAI